MEWICVSPASVEVLADRSWFVWRRHLLQEPIPNICPVDLDGFMRSRGKLGGGTLPIVERHLGLVRRSIDPNN
jgi:hypothetical protein